MVLIAYGDRIISNELVFPSPCGDYGSYHEVAPWEADEEQSEFPSPCGDYGSYLWITSKWMAITPSSFRPLAGIMVLIKQKNRAKKSHLLKVSVPLRGLWFLSLGFDSNAPFPFEMFPSPCGDYGSYLIQILHSMNSLIKWFPSPCGDYGSYRMRF